MEKPSVVKPTIQALSTEQINQIHTASLEILSKTGVQVDSNLALKVFKTTIGTEITSGNQVRINPELVEWALKSAPPIIDIYNRKGNLAFQLGDGSIRFGIGVTALYYQDPVSNDLIPFSRKHMAEMVLLGDSLPNYDVVCTIGVLQDMPVETADLYAVLEMVANTSKPLIVLISEGELFPKALDTIEFLYGNLTDKPSIIPYFNPITPLVINRDTAEKMAHTIDRGLPFIYSTYGMVGGTTPITPAGTLALMNAELLAGLVLSQLVKEGTPIILGMLPAYLDMRTMVNFYDPLSWLINLASAEMMTFYGIPHCGTSGSASGWGGDILAFGDYWMNHLLSCIGKAGLVPFVGDTLGGKSFSPLNVVYVNEIIERVLRIKDGFVLSDELMALADVMKLGPGGHFLSTDLTRKHYRDAYITSEIFPNLTMEAWQELNKPRAMDKLVTYTAHLLGTLSPPDDFAEVLARGESYIETIV